MSDRITLPPSFEEHCSPLSRSNDGHLTIGAFHDEPGYAVTDDRDAHIELYALRSKSADAFVAGYDYHERVTRDEANTARLEAEVEARADTEALAPHDFGRTPGERALALLITDPAIRAHIDPKALVQARAALGLGFADPRQAAIREAWQQYPEATDTGAEE